MPYMALNKKLASMNKILSLEIFFREVQKSWA